MSGQTFDSIRTFQRIAVALLLTVCLTAVVMAVGSDKAMYVGGTITGLQEKAEGRIVTTSEEQFAFNAGGKGTVAIPYASIVSLEYGQKAGRRVAVAVLVTPWALFSKKRKHYLTVTYNDQAGK
jgi:hypothetical protein